VTLRVHQQDPDYLLFFCVSSRFLFLQVLGVEQVEDEIQIMTKHEFEQFEKTLLAEKGKEENQP